MELSPSRRIRRGFTRLGFALGVAIGVGCATIGVSLSYSGMASSIEYWDTRSCLKKAWLEHRAIPRQQDNRYIDAKASGCPDAYQSWGDLAEFTQERPSWFSFFTTSFFIVAASGALSVGVFVFSWAIGWILSGFARD